MGFWGVISSKSCQKNTQQLHLQRQRKILIDVINAPSCSQTIAITHSPFVFDNELEPYAKSLSLKIDYVKDGEQADYDEEDDIIV